ncbi:5'-nucleotidase SurE [hydrothermal vent metagenome]|uniref:5'-nucleotidase n=1 Tax=hydrothermal vent metagenome TaxID=652676 RepID=A0A3B1BW33_9ZZZZ
MRVLLTNDDGINARGIAEMRAALAKNYDVTVVAPESEMSAVGHAITLTDPLRVRKINKNGDFFGYGVNGTPADCVKIAVRAILDEKPDIVVSGINHGHNVATNVIYSGTVSAATEGMILGIPSIAISLSTFETADFSQAAVYGARIARMAYKKGIPADSLLNVNVPAIPENEIKGVKICKLGVSKFIEEFERRVDLRNNDYYWQGGAMNISEEDKETDITYLKEGWVTVTPIHFDLTTYKFLGDLEKWEI